MSDQPAAREGLIRVVLADDHDVVRRGLAMVLEASGEFTVVGEARTGYEAVERASQLRPDLLLLDVRMPGIDGVEAARLIKQEAPEVRILILTGITASPTTLTLFKGAADGYVLKDATPAELLDAAQRVARGIPYLQASLIRRLLGALPVEQEQQQGEALSSPLTPRELDVLRLMATSHTNREIANQLHVGEETVRTHVKHILGKLYQPDRTQAVIAAVRAGLLDVG